MPRPATLPSGNSGHTYWSALTHAWTFHATGNAGGADADDIKGANDATLSGTAALDDSVGLDSPAQADKATITDVVLANGFSVMFRAKLDAVGNNSMIFGKNATSEYFWLDSGADRAEFKSTESINFLSLTDANKTSLYDYCVVVYPESGGQHDIKLFYKTAAATTWTEIDGSANSASLADRTINTIASGYGATLGMTGEVEYFYIFDGTSFTLANLDADFADPYDIVAGSSITLTDQAATARVKCIKSSGTYAITLAGTYTGTPTTIEWRPIVTASGAGSWSTLDATPSGNVFSEVVNVDGTEWMQGIEVRFSNSQGVTDSDALFTVCEVFILDVDSIAAGRNVTKETHTPRTYTALILDTSGGTGWNAASDPAGGTYGSHWPILADLLADDRPVAWINSGQGGAEMTGVRSTAYTSVVSSGGSGGINGVLMHGGANDINTPTSTTDSAAAWQTECEAVADSMATQWPGCVTYFAILGEVTTGTDARASFVREGVQLAVANNANCSLGADLWSIALPTDGLHPKDTAEATEYAKAWWFALRTGATSAPAFVQATHNSGKTVVTVEYDATLRTGTTLTTGCFTVYDDGTPVAISSAAVTGGNKVAITLSSAASGTITVSQGYGQDPVGTPPQGTAVSLPDSGGNYYPAASPFFDEAVSAADDTPPVFASAAIPTGGTVVNVTFTEAGSPPLLPVGGVTGFSLSSDGGSLSILSACRSASTVITLAVDRPILDTETVTVSYSSGNITDSAPALNAVADFGPSAITNNSTQTAGGGTFPTESQVLTGIVFGPTDNLTGNVVLPAVGDVEEAVAFGASSALTGTFASPNENLVYLDTGYGAGGTEFTGNMVLPSANNVRSGIAYGSGGAATGTLVLPSAAQVLNSVGFGAAGTEFTGTVVLPAVGDVQAAVTFGASSALTGTFAVPTEAQVESGVGFGAGGTEFTGTFVGGGAGSDAPFSTLTVTCVDQNGVVEEGVSVTMKIRSAPTGDTGYAYDDTDQTELSNSSGIVSLVGIRGATYLIKRGTSARWKEITLADAATTTAPSFIGSP